MSCCMENTVYPDQLANLKKPADLDLHCFQLTLYRSGFILFIKEFINGISKEQAKLSSVLSDK